MKGIIFTEFIEMVEAEFGYEVVDDIIVKSEVDSDGAYTAVGTYPSAEIFALVHQLSIKKNIPISTLLNIFGKYLFHRFSAIYPFAFEGMGSAFELLEMVEEHIHVQVKKLYPDAELPTFKINRENENQLEMVYESERRMGDLAVGLMEGCLEHFGEKAVIEKTNIIDGGKIVTFKITKN